MFRVDRCGHEGNICWKDCFQILISQTASERQGTLSIYMYTFI